MDYIFLDDPTFRSLVRNYLEPPSYEPRHQEIFRFMDLPTEIRIKISEYALHGRDGLRWCWTPFDPKPRIGTFDKLMPRGYYDISGLTRLSRQVRMETKHIIFKVNILRFQGGYMRNDDEDSEIEDGEGSGSMSDYNSDFKGGLTGSMVAFRHFSNFSSRDLLEATRHILFDAGSDKIMSPPILTALARRSFLNPKLNTYLLHSGWTFREHTKKPKAFAKSLKVFFETAGEIAELLEKCMGETSKRTWRILPNVSREPRERALNHLKEHLSAEDYDKAIQWISNGL